MRLLQIIFCISLLLLTFRSDGYCDHPETKNNKFTTIVSENETLNIPVESNKHVYLILKFTNLSDTKSIFYTSSGFIGKPLDDSLQGPLSFRTVTLEQKKSTSTKTFLCKEKDQLTVFVQKGIISVDAVKTE